jgi:hypothetical protein
MWNGILHERTYGNARSRTSRLESIKAIHFVGISVFVHDIAIRASNQARHSYIVFLIALKQLVQITFKLLDRSSKNLA